MDIQQFKKYSTDKINSDKITKKVRDTIKTIDWQKQDMREGFKESFSPLIESQASIKKSIDDQQNATLAQLKANQLALTDKENKLGELITAMLSITDGEEQGVSTSGEKDIRKKDDDDDDDLYSDASDKLPSKTKTIKINPFDFSKNLYNKESQDILKNLGYDNLPHVFFDTKNINDISDLISDVSIDIAKYQSDTLKNIADFEMKPGSSYPQAIPRSKNPRTETKEKINQFNTLIKYLENLNNLFAYKQKVMSGKGINNYKSPLQLLDRLELLGGSIIAGNNGVLQEFSEIAHLLALNKVISKKQLNKLLKTYIAGAPTVPPAPPSLRY